MFGLKKKKVLLYFCLKAPTAAVAMAAARSHKKEAVSPFFNASRKKILGLLSASVERFHVSRVRDLKKNLCGCVPVICFGFPVIYHCLTVVYPCSTSLFYTLCNLIWFIFRFWELTATSCRFRDWFKNHQILSVGYGSTDY